MPLSLRSSLSEGSQRQRGLLLWESLAQAGILLLLEEYRRNGPRPLEPIAGSPQLDVYFGRAADNLEVVQLSDLFS